MSMVLDWFQLTPIPMNAMTGTYSPMLVTLSYIIAVLASYVALDLVGRLRDDKDPKAKLYWMFGGAFAMGAGIWSMHFIGMLAFFMPMAMGYNLMWTAYSFIVAIFASALALFMLREKNRKAINLIMGGVLVGLGIATMHYMGMQGMTNYVCIHYLPSLFFISIAIGIFAAEVALWLALKSNQGSPRQQFTFKVAGALVMGFAICGMHYMGMAAAVFTPLPNAMVPNDTIPPDLLAFFVAGITGLIISLALTASTYYKHMVNAVQNEKEFLNAMLDNLEDGIVACDADGKITVFNDVLQKKLNLGHVNNLSNELSDYFELYPLNSEQAIKGTASPLRRALNGEIIHATELIMKFPNGAIRNVVIDGQPIINAAGKKLGAVIAIHDVTEIKKTEKIKSEFVSVVSHELRTPLTSIRGALGLLLSGTIDTFVPKTQKLLEIANRNCERLLLLINDILDIEKINAGKMKFDLKVINLTQLVEDAMATNKMYCEKFEVEIKLINMATDVNVNVDPDRLSQVLANLISNAAKFSTKKSTITIKMNVHDEEVRVAVCNYGLGIPLDFQELIFQKFSQADSSDTRGKGGTGLGLNISKAIIEKFDGKINFTSVPNEETIFYFDLPISHAPITPLSVISKEALTVTKKILICESDKVQANILSGYLKETGFDSDIAHSIEEAKVLLSKNSYRGVLLDLLLPDEDGITFIRELRKSKLSSNLPIIVISLSISADKELLNGDALLVVDWLDKPINSNKILEAISRLKPQADNDLPKILHVEDDLDVQQVIAALLENKANITAAQTIRDTINKLNESNFDLVILDLMLPDGNGAELLPIFSKYKIPIIVYSVFDLDREYGKYVTKAFVKSKNTNDEILTTIKDLLAKNF